MRAAPTESLTISSRRSALLGDRYELGSVIATGGMGRVWRARDTVLDRAVAVKVLAGGLTEDPTFLTRFRYEARHAALVADPHIAAVHDYGEGVDEDGAQVAYLVMELVEGETLASLMRGDGLDLAGVLDVVRQTAAALAAAHAAGVVHRDVKPANVLVRPDGVVKLTDFGIAWSAANVPLTHAGQVLGSVHYLAPERVEGARATAASDVYSLGVIAYECLAGARPFDGDNVAATALRHVHEVPPPLPDHLPAAVRDLVERAMARHPEERIPDGAALRDAVDTLLVGGGRTDDVDPDRHPTVVLAAEDVPQEAAIPAGRGPARVRTAIAAAVALVVLVLVIGGALALAPDSSGTPGVVARSAPPSSPSTPVTSAAPTARTTVSLTADGIVGRPVDEVRADLVAAGLTVQLRPTTAAGVPAGQVVAIDPVGEVAVGQLITLTFATASPAPAPATGSAATVAPVPSTSSVPAGATASDAGPRRGHGRGHGHG